MKNNVKASQSDNDNPSMRTCTLKKKEAKTSHQCIKIEAVDTTEKSSAYLTLYHFISLLTIGLFSWGLLWCAFGDGWRWDGPWLRLTAVAVVAWASGRALQALTTLPPLLMALITGILARNLNLLDMRYYTHIDVFLRKIYPVVILGKASLGWDLKYMKENWQKIFARGVLPWAGEAIAMATCTHYLLHFPWIWSFLLGPIHASVSLPVVLPSVKKLSTKTDGTRNWVQLVSNTGGIDTALCVGVYGLVHTYMFVEAEDIYRYVKAAVTLPAGVALGVACGTLAGRVMHPQDYYVAEIRVLLVLLGGLMLNFATLHFGWGGVGGVAVLVCNATAATFWSRDGWKLNDNPASTAYRVLWDALEPSVFAFTGTFFVIKHITAETMLSGLASMLVSLTVRMMVLALACWDMTIKEKIFMCCVWSPRSIVEAVMGPYAIDTLNMVGSKSGMEHAEDMLTIIVQTILITTPVSFLLTNILGPILINTNENNKLGKWLRKQTSLQA